jgi:hypothetical protein
MMNPSGRIHCTSYLITSRGQFRILIPSSAVLHILDITPYTNMSGQEEADSKTVGDRGRKTGPAAGKLPQRGGGKWSH